MKNHAPIQTFAATLACSFPPAVTADMNHGHAPVYLFALDRLEYRDAGGDPLHWKMHGWIGGGEPTAAEARARAATPAP